MAEASRIQPLEGRHAVRNGVTISPARPATRISLRAPSASLAPLSSALGIKLPDRPGGSVSKGGRHALWLGPDEWLVIDEAEADLMSACARVSTLHSAVDISHRNTAILVSGPGAEDVLSAGCPRDLALAAFPVGQASRTVFGKVEIVLLRTGEDAFRLEVWRSFSDYTFTLLEVAARDLG
jgi:sarcosine oxidase, subunit gamma